ncbi:metalloregulator ArsR/SmtB family transcription factor [Chitiniphilus purpureus]|uniref:Metalloregulator ArsR/SmtB family transcription factor n=1 Tax=Chitiniphilus purpureus TaxID=2981137 RepID=A0ABY6DH41_9NEIS|nr:metalloregulator ArsR/SmtB family transcription factor [Chitiniphilus sp. CD1]UXY13665.1 metalloregulator ArsR/SmtB family transcription factor [Chitiniphilus sp. CD1]
MTNYSLPLDLVFHALADPSRLAMVERLCQGPASVSELARPLAISLPSVLQHLKLLEDSGLVRSRKVGRVRTCELDREVMVRAEDWFAERRRYWTGRLDRLADLLGATEPILPPEQSP